MALELSTGTEFLAHRFSYMFKFYYILVIVIGRVRQTELASSLRYTLSCFHLIDSNGLARIEVAYSVLKLSAVLVILACSKMSMYLHSEITSFK